MRNRVTAYTLAILLVLSAACGGLKVTTDPTQRINQLQATADVIAAQIQIGLSLADQLATIPDLQAIARFKDEIALAKSTLAELQGASQPFFDAVKGFAAGGDKTALRAAFARLQAAVVNVRPHTDIVIGLLVDYLNAHGKPANLDKIRLGIMLARVAFDGAMTIIPGLIT